MRKKLIFDFLKEILFYTVIILPILIIALFSLYNEANEFRGLKQRYTITNGKVESVYYSPVNRGHMWLVSYNYNVGGTEYDGITKLWWKTVKEGKDITVYYDPVNPSKSTADISINIYRNALMIIILASIYLTAFCLSVWHFLHGLRLERGKKYLVFTQWKEERVNEIGITPRFRIICSCTLNGKKYEFASKPYLSGKCPYKQGDRIEIYVDSGKMPKIYYFAPKERI